MPAVGVTELLIIAAIVLLLFGGTFLPRFARGAGEAIANFRSAIDRDRAARDRK